MAIKRNREALVHQHLERVSRKLLEEHFDIVRKRIGRNAGIYALYKKNKLYYIGLASALSARLKAHLRDRHKGSWDHFAIYFTIRDHHIRELESLLLRIVRPNGNVVTGKPKGSKDILPLIRQEIAIKQRLERRQLFGRGAKAETDGDGPAQLDQIRVLFPEGGRVQAVYKDQKFKARIRKDGRVRLNGETFESLGLAAKNATGRRKNSWRFWRVERGKGNWVQLRDIRRAGTPLLASKKKSPTKKRHLAAKKAWITRREAATKKVQSNT